MIKKVIITGANKGIGFGIVQNLAAKPDWHIIMAVRNIQLGDQAKNEILHKFPKANISVEKLDISDSASIGQFVETIKAKYQTVDVLCNNAAVAVKGDDFNSQVIKFTFQPNVYGTIELSEKILPLIRDNGKIITVGSQAGRFAFSKITNEDLKNQFRRKDLTKEELFKLIHQFQSSVADNTFAEKGWPKSGYGVSKLSIFSFKRIFSRNQDVVKRGIQVYTCCPGYVNTDMTSHKGSLTIQEGALTPVFLIEKPFQLTEEDQGEFYYLKEKIQIVS